jgi:hypothetical protein
VRGHLTAIERLLATAGAPDGRDDG